MTSALSDSGGGIVSLQATLKDVLPRLGSGVNLYEAPARAAGNSKLRIDLRQLQAQHASERNPMQSGWNGKTNGVDLLA